MLSQSFQVLYSKSLIVHIDDDERYCLISRDSHDTSIVKNIVWVYERWQLYDAWMMGDLLVMGDGWSIDGVGPQQPDGSTVGGCQQCRPNLPTRDSCIVRIAH